MADKKQRQVVTEHIYKVMDMMDKTKANSNRYKEMFAKMSDTEFDRYMRLMKDGKIKLRIVAPNLKLKLNMTDLRDAAVKTGTKLFHKVWFKDQDTGRKYLTNEEYLVVKVPVRRQQQFLDKKLSVSKSDKHIDPLSGQVVVDDRAAALSNPEIQVLYSRGLEATLMELIKVRGGDIHAYSEFKRQSEEGGIAEMNMIDMNSRTRSSVIAGVYLNGIHLANNI